MKICKCVFLTSRIFNYFSLGPFVNQRHEYSEKTLSVACAASALISLLVGFLGGFLFTKKCSAKDQRLKCGHTYLEARMLERYVVNTVNHWGTLLHLCQS